MHTKTKRKIERDTKNPSKRTHGDDRRQQQQTNKQTNTVMMTIFIRWKFSSLGFSLVSFRFCFSPRIEWLAVSFLSTITGSLFCALARPYFGYFRAGWSRFVLRLQKRIVQFSTKARHFQCLIYYFLHNARFIRDEQI